VATNIKLHPCPFTNFSSILWGKEHIQLLNTPTATSLPVVNSFQLPRSAFSSCRDILPDCIYPDAGKYVLVRFSSDPATRSHPVRYL